MLGLEWVSLSLPWFIVAATLYSILWYDIHTIKTIFALVFLSLIVYVLKETIRVDRMIDDFGIGHSLPSLHASAVTFLSSYYIYLFLDSDWSFEMKSFRISMAAIYAILIYVSRIFLQYNTFLDVYIGMGTGFLCTIAFVSYQKEMIIKYD